MSDVFSIEGSYNLVDRVSEKLKTVSKEVDKAGDTVKKSEDKFASFSNKMNKIGDGMQKVGGNMTKFLTLPIAGAGVASFKLASDMDESMNKVKVACGDSAKGVEEFSKTTLKQFGIAKGTTLDMVSTFADMGGGMGLTTEQASKMGMELVGLAGDMASFKNVRVDVAQTALNGIYTGETESLKQLGIIMTEANLQEFALAQGINKKVSEMTQAEKVNLRYAYVTNASKNATGDFARTNDGAANQMRMFTEGMKELGATLGTHLLPLITPIINKLNEWVQKFGEMDEKTQKVILVIGGLIAIAGPLIMFLGGIASGIAALSGLFATTTVVTGGATVATAGFGAALSAAILPVTLFIAAIVGIVGALTYLWNNNEAFRERVFMLWDSIKNFITTICDTIKAIWGAWGDDIMRVVDLVMQVVGGVLITAFDIIIGIFNFFTSLLKGDWQGCFEALGTIVTDILNGIIAFISDCINLILGIFGTDLQSVVGTVTNIFNNIKNAIMNPFETAVNAIKWGVEKIKGFLNFSWEFPKLKMPHFSVSGSMNPLKWLDEGVPKIGVEWYSKGGIFTQPTVLGNIGVGDAQNGKGNKAEAVLPIDDLRGMIKDLLQVQIAMVVDGKEFVRQVVAPHNEEITEYNRQFSY